VGGDRAAVKFSVARLFLERASELLQGDDETSKQARLALDLLVEAVITKQYSKTLHADNIARFPNGTDREI
jgi:hypothetical protein